MTLRPLDALKSFAVLFPVLMVARWIGSFTFEPIDNWPSTIAYSVLFSLFFSLLYTAYRKPKT